MELNKAFKTSGHRGYLIKKPSHWQSVMIQMVHQVVSSRPYNQQAWLSLAILPCSIITDNQLGQQNIIINPAVNSTLFLLYFSRVSTLSYSHTRTLSM
jgi:hypothetical protein